MRPINEDGSWGSKQKKEYILNENDEKIYDPKKRQYKCRSIPSTDWNDRGKADEWRKAWEDAANAELERLGFESRIDRRTYEEQGIEKVATVHMGVAASQMEQRGIRTDRGNQNREIAVTNQRLRQLKARIAKLQTWLKEEAANAELPNLADIVANILSQRVQAGKSGRYQSISNLKVASKMLNFLQENEIKDMAGLEEKVKSMHRKQYDIRDKLKPIEHRLKTLNEHIAQTDVCLQHKSVCRQYQQLKPKNQAVFAEKHRAEISLFESAERYLKGIMNGKTVLPIKAWKAEQTKLAEQHAKLNKEYVLLKAGVQEVEQMRRGVRDIIRKDERKTHSRHSL